MPALGLLRRYGWAIAALELNGMRSRAENQGVVELARHVTKPLLGGGDSHLLMPSSALCASRAATYADFVAEVRSGWGRPIVTREYFSSSAMENDASSAELHRAVPRDRRISAESRSTLDSTAGGCSSTRSAGWRAGCSARQTASGAPREGDHGFPR